MKTEKCSHCGKNRKNNSPVSFVWWFVKGVGKVCWRCYEKKIK